MKRYETQYEKYCLMSQDSDGFHISMKPVALSTS